MRAIGVLVVLACSAVCISGKAALVEEDNWRDILQGEWMIEFYAPWCPACKDLAKAWRAFSDWSRDLDIRVGEVDVTLNPGLSGRFLVTALPTIYHVKDGVFRLYSGSRDKEDFMKFVEDKKWTSIDPIPSWKYPDSVQMGVVAQFFKLSMSVRDAHNNMVEKQGIPVWGSYAIFAGATLFLGCILGFFIVCIIDMVFPSGGKMTTKAVKKDKPKKKSTKKDKDSDEETEQNEGNEAVVSNGKSFSDKKKK